MIRLNVLIIYFLLVHLVEDRVAAMSTKARLRVVIFIKGFSIILLPVIVPNLLKTEYL